MDLCNACEKGDLEGVIKSLQANLENIHKLVGKHRVQCTALHYAAEYGHLDIVEELLAHGADANKRNSDGRLPLHDACIGWPDVVQYLVAFTDDINCLDNQGQSCAHVASFNGELRCLKILLHNDADIELVDGNHRSCLDLAVTSDHSDVANLLLQKHPTLLSKTDKEGRSAVHRAAQSGAVNCLKCFYRKNTDIRCCDAKGVTPVHVAAKHGMVSCVKFLLQSGCMVTDTDKHGRTVAHFAAASGSVDCLHWILENNADVDRVDDSGNTIAHYACMYAKSAEIINCLRQHDVDFDAVNKKNDTPFHCARAAGFPVAFQKGLTGEITCPNCVNKTEKIAYDEAHKPSIVEEKITLQQSSLFGVNSAPKSRKNAKQLVKTERSLAGKYYGKEIFDVPAGLDLGKK